MKPFKNSQREPEDDGQGDAAEVDPNVDYDPGDHEAQSGPGQPPEPNNPGG